MKEYNNLYIPEDGSTIELLEPWKLKEKTSWEFKQLNNEIPRWANKDFSFTFPIGTKIRFSRMFVYHDSNCNIDIKHSELRKMLKICVSISDLNNITKFKVIDNFSNKKPNQPKFILTWNWIPEPHIGKEFTYFEYPDVYKYIDENIIEYASKNVSTSWCNEIVNGLLPTARLIFKSTIKKQEAELFGQKHIEIVLTLRSFKYEILDGSENHLGFANNQKGVRKIARNYVEQLIKTK